VRGLTSERNEADATPLAALKAERATVAAKGRQIETEAAPIRYVAERLGPTLQRAGHPVADLPDGAVL
jgi:hypothetical protein